MTRYLFLFTLVLFFSCENSIENVKGKVSTDNKTSNKLTSKHEPFDYENLRLFGPEVTAQDISAYKKSMQLAKNTAPTKNDIFNGEWTQQGPGNIGGRVNIVATHPENADIIYAGFARGGLWKTVDGGLNWISLWENEITQAVSALAIDPNNPSIIYAGTGDINISGNVFLGDGLYKSEDDGANWNYIGLAEASIVGDILINPDNSDHITVATMGNPFVKDSNRGIYYSVDGGVTWNQSLFIADDSGIHDLAYNPDNPSVMIAGAWTRYRTGKVSYISGENSKAYRSTDHGVTWTLMDLDVPQITGRTAVCFSQNNPNLAYTMVMGEDSKFHSLHKSVDAGETWAIIDTTNESTPNMMGGFGWFFGRIASLVDPITNTEKLYLSGVDLWTYDEAFDYWDRATPPWWYYEVHADKHALLNDADGNILLGTDGGLYRLGASGIWEDIENIPNNMFYRVAYNPHLPDLYYGGMQDNGSAGGNEDMLNDWVRIYGGDGFQMEFDPTNSEAFYAETQNGNIVYTDDSGYNFYGIGLDTFSQDRRNWDMQFIISPHDPNVLYTGTYRAIKLTNSAGFHQAEGISGQLTDDLEFISSYHTITALDESSIKEGLLYYGTADGNVWKGEDGVFTKINSSLPKLYVTSIKASPIHEDYVYVTLSDYKFNNHSPRIYRSDDKGATWEAIGNGLPDGAVNDVVIYEGYGDSILFSATNIGVYATINAGETWYRLGESLPLIPVNDMVINVEKNELVAGTFGRSVNTYPIDSITKSFSTPINNKDVATIDITVFPNPVVDQLNIHADSKVACSVYDVSGNKILDTNKDTRLIINTTLWNSGSYIVVVADENGRQLTKRIIKL